jgi:hypothetical protein
MRRSILLLPLLSATALALPAAAGETLRFEVAKGQKIVKTVLTNHELNVDEIGSTREGSPLMRENIGGWLTSGRRMVVVDEYLAVDAGRPQALRRTFRNVEGNGKINLTGGRGRIEERVQTRCPLEGQVVTYTWVPEENDYGRTYDHLYGEEQLLLELRGDTDLVALLPDGEVEVGATWILDPSAMKDALAPSGNLGSVPVKPGFFSRMFEVGVGGDLADVLGRELTGSARATLVAVRTVDGRRLAEVGLELTLASERDRTLAYLTGMPDEERREASSLQRVVLTWNFNGEGVLLWDLDAGHAASLRIEGHESVTAEVFKSGAIEGGVVVDGTQRSTYTGQLEHEIKYKAKKAADGE